MPHPFERTGSPGGVVAIFVAYAAVHSLLAARPVKEAARGAFGERARNGLYRPFYMLQSFVTFGLAVWAFVRLPDRTLYRVPRPWSWLLHAGQVASICVAAAAGFGVGIERITGLAPLLSYLRGDAPAPEPEAQGPPPSPDGEMALRGIFRWTRHPANWGFMPLVPLHPHMTVNRAVLAALSVAYLLLGSVHEEARLRARYGEAYDRYRSRVSFLVG